MIEALVLLTAAATFYGLGRLDRELREDDRG